MGKRTKPRLMAGRARVEFLGCKPTIDDLLTKGHSVADIYRLLRGKGTITMGCRSFYHNATKYCASLRHDSPAGTIRASPAPKSMTSESLSPGHVMSNELLEEFKELCRGTSLESPRN